MEFSSLFFWNLSNIEMHPQNVPKTLACAHKPSGSNYLSKGLNLTLFHLLLVPIFYLKHKVLTF